MRSGPNSRYFSIGISLAGRGGMKDIKQFRMKNPCNERWDNMHGDDRSRFCERCETQVVNISSMTAKEVEGLGDAKAGGFCLRYLAGPDGSPVLIRRSFLRRIALLIAILVPALAPVCRDNLEGRELGDSILPGQGFVGLE